MKMNSYKIAGLSVLAACAMAFAPMSATYAADAAKKDAKPVSCKQEAKNKGIKDKAEIKKYVAECKKARKEAKKDAKK